MASFNIIICGAGLGGLGAAIALRLKGHHVTVLEGASQLAEVGAGIQIPPNSSRILTHYGLYEELANVVVWPQRIRFRRYANGVTIGKTPLHPTMKDKYGYPYERPSKRKRPHLRPLTFHRLLHVWLTVSRYWLIHRADYHMTLLNRARVLGVDIRANSLVVGVNEDEISGPTVALADGSTMAADIVVGADGVRSKVRESILGDTNVEPVDSTNCAYRATVPGDVMRQDPEVAHLMDDIDASCWIGGDRHIMAYPMRRGELYNLVMSHPGKVAPGRSSEPGNLTEMKQHYSSFDPVIQKVLTKVEGCLRWRLADVPMLPRWVGKSGKVVLIGDAAHAMVPYLAQGAATSIEDGAALAECLGRAQSKNDVPNVLQAFEDIRKPRCDIIQAGSRANGGIWHLHDGPEQQRRDLAMGGEAGDDHKVEDNPNRWSDKAFQPWLFGYDTIAETNAHLDNVLGTGRELHGQELDRKHEHMSSAVST